MASARRGLAAGVAMVWNAVARQSTLSTISSPCAFGFGSEMFSMLMMRSSCPTP